MSESLEWYIDYCKNNISKLSEKGNTDKDKRWLEVLILMQALFTEELGYEKEPNN